MPARELDIGFSLRLQSLALHAGDTEAARVHAFNVKLSSGHVGVFVRWIRRELAAG